MKRIISTICAAAMFVGTLILSPATALADAPALKEDSALILTKDGSAVCGTGGAITAEKLASEFEGSVTVKKPDGTVLEGTKKVPTGSTVVMGDSFIPVIVSGDANEDGNINLGDVSTIMKKIARWDISINETASLVSGGAKLSLADVSTVLKFIAGWDVRLGNMKVVVNESAVKATAEDGGMDLWLDHSTKKLNRDNVTSTGNFTYVINSAKNEIEGANIYVVPTKDYADLQISVTDFVNCYGDKVTAEALSFHYVKMGSNGYLPDALMPAGCSYETKISAGTSQGYMVKAKTAVDSVPGLYEATISLKSEGAEVKRAKIYLNVWDFALNDEDACDTAFGLGRYSVFANHGVTGDTTQEDADALFQNYYDFLLENRMNGFVLPYDITTEKGQEYMSDPRVHAFVIAGSGYDGGMNRTDAQIAEYYDILSEHPEWLEKGYFYYLDEPLPDDRLPNNKEAYYNIGNKYNELQTKFKDGWQMIPLETCHGYNLTDDFYNATKGFVQIYCPKTYAFTPEKYRDTPGAQVFLEAEDTAKHGTFEEVIDSWVADGTIKKLWWYFSCSTLEPYPNYHAQSEGILPRVSGWQQFIYDVDGILYYSVQEYGSKNPFRDIRYQTTDVYGDGILLYPGLRYGLDGPIGSIRVDYIRDGIEDYMYLKMAERIAGRDAVNEILSTVARDMIDYTRDADVLLAARAELAKIIEAAQAE